VSVPQTFAASVKNYVTLKSIIPFQPSAPV